MQFSLKLLLNLIVKVDNDVVIMNVKLYIFFYIATTNDYIHYLDASHHH